MNIRRQRLLRSGSLILIVACSACGASQAQSPPRAAGEKPSEIIPAPAGAIAATPPQPNGTVWVLASSGTNHNIQEVDVTDSKLLGIVPVGSSARDLAQLSTGELALGLATSDTGAVELRNGTSGALLGTVPVSSPVIALASGSDGVTIYALEHASNATTVAIIDTQNDSVTATVPVPLDSIGLAVSPDQSVLYLLRSAGDVAQVQTAGGKLASASFRVGPSPLAESISPNGSTLYVLKQAGNGTNVAVVSVSTEQVLRALPAPANAVDLGVSPTGQNLYLLDGTASHGNIQVFSTS